METYWKLLAVVLAGCAAAVLQPGGAFRRLSAAACCCAAALLAAELIGPVLRMGRQLAALSEVGSAVFAPVWKAAAIGLATQLAVGFCRDAGEQALCEMLELGGVLSVLYVSLPLFSAVLDLLKTWIGD